jgi:cell pole-organizing protein PopZ
MSALIARQNEPTMDEILASIRKIISDDLGDGASAGASVSNEAKAEVFELSTQMALPSAKEPAWNMPISRRNAANVEPQAQANIANLDPVSAVTELAARMARLSTNGEPINGMPSAEAQNAAPVAPAAKETISAVSSAFGSLRQSIERETVADKAVASAMQTVVEAALRPMLKEWIDAHLPPMVERLVKAEIERMAKKV